MKIILFSCFSLTFLTVCVFRVNCGVNNGLNPLNQLTGRYNMGTTPGLNTVASYRGYGYPRPFPRRLVQFLPVPFVKKVTHHHIHHVIAHKGVVKSKYTSEKGFDLNNGDQSKGSDNYVNYNEYKVNNSLRGDLNDNGFKSTFNKRGGSQMPVVPVTNAGALGHRAQGRKTGIRGFIGDQRAEFVPIVIGIIDDSTFKSGSDANREYSSRMGQVRPRRKEYIPPRETVKLFEDLAKLGFK